MNYLFSGPFRKNLIWPLIEAINLRVGRAGKAAAKNTTRSEEEVWRFFKRHLHGLECRKGVNLPQAKAK
jgi:hypothetical protein